MVKTIVALAAVAMLVGPAQSEFDSIDVSTITGATLIQDARIDPRDLVPNGDGSYHPKPNARLTREDRSCALEPEAARTVAEALKHARRSPKQWEGLGSDLTIRFRGAEGRYGKLVAVLEGFGDENPQGETRIFFAGVAAFLSKQDQAVVAKAAEAAGCPLSKED